MPNRKRPGRDTEILTPEQLAEQIAKRLADNAAVREPAPDRVRFDWPDDPCEPDEPTKH